MILFGGALGLLALGVWIFCIIDAITTPADQVRTLPKLAWVAIVILLIDIGSVAWLIAGRPWNAKATTPRGAVTPRGGSTGMSATAARRRTPTRPLSPDDDDEWLASLATRPLSAPDAPRDTEPGSKPDAARDTEPGSDPDGSDPGHTGRRDDGPQPIG